MTATEPRSSLPRLYLLDVEGTVSPISLVTEQLFPYVRAHFESYLKTSIAELEKNPESFERSLAEGGLLWPPARHRIGERRRRTRRRRESGDVSRGHRAGRGVDRLGGGAGEGGSPGSPVNP